VQKDSPENGEAQITLDMPFHEEVQPVTHARPLNHPAFSRGSALQDSSENGLSACSHKSVLYAPVRVVLRSLTQKTAVDATSTDGPGPVPAHLWPGQDRHAGLANHGELRT
jgi:hypothetical protein